MANIENAYFGHNNAIRSMRSHQMGIRRRRYIADDLGSRGSVGRNLAMMNEVWPPREEELM